MLNVYAIDGIIPVVHETAYVHPSAVLIGDVLVGPNAYVGPLASLRGDFGRIVMRSGSNVQDGCVVHGTTKLDTIIEENGHIGHGAILHGCTIGRDTLIGMGAVIMDGAIIGEGCIVGALSFVKAGMTTPPRKLVIGSPARVVRDLTEKSIQGKNFGTLKYQLLTKRCLATMEKVKPLTKEESDRRRLTPDLVDPKSESS